MGRWHAVAARHLGARIVAVVDPNIEAARQIAGTDAAAYPALNQALATPVDLVHICAPLDSHVSLCREALAAGCHVLVEKPATTSLAEARILTAEARAAGRLLVPVHQFGFQEGVRRILAGCDAIGPIRHVEFAACSAGADRVPALDRDAVAADIVPHAFSLARALLSTSVGELHWQLERAVPG